MNANADKLRAELGHARIGITSHLTPRGSLNEPETIEQLRDAIEECVQARETQLVIDCPAVHAVNSVALEMLLDMQDRLLRLGGWLKVAGVTPLVREVFRITGFDQYVVVADDDKHAAVEKVQTGSHRFGDILLDMGCVNETNLQKAIKLQEKRGDRIGKILVEQGWVSKQDLLIALGEQLEVPWVRLRPGVFDPEVVSMLDYATACRLNVLPLFRVRGVLYLATAQPQAIPSIGEVAERANCAVKPVVALPEDIRAILNENPASFDMGTEIFGDVDEDFAVVEQLLPDDYTAIDELAAGSPVINLVNAIIQRAVRDGASDIHIEPFRTKTRIRYRIDGVLYEFKSPKIELHPAIVSRLKVMANLDISERRLPQDGRVQVHTQGRSVDLRFSSLPGLFGEKIVLRVLDKNQVILDIDKLGMSDETNPRFREMLRGNYGMLLATGPTGSGKTTTLYAALSHLNSIEKNIVTIEDPIEYQIDIVNQNEIKPAIGLTFSRMLKHVLRQDPDIVMVGEIREHETAETAVQAALTGHLVFSTLHTNDAVGAITRLIDMGVEPYLLSSALVGVVAQRLVRTICPACKTSYRPTTEMLERYCWKKSDKIRLYKGRGCSECYDSGYKGRVAIHEVLATDRELQQLIMRNPSRDELVDFMKASGGKTLFEDGLDRVREGRTTLEEVMRAIAIG